jgi:histidine decarboxylase
MNNVRPELEALYSRLKNNMEYYIGYPPNTDFDYSELDRFLELSINNLGDPYALLNPFSTHEFEVEVINWFLKLYGSDSSRSWGYVTNGGTEGILFGMLLGRAMLENPVVYFTKAAHYAIPKNAAILGLPSQVIKTDHQGEMDYDDFSKRLDPNRGALIVACFGTTMTSAIDRADKIRAILEANKMKYYIHADAAFDGMILPWVENAYSYQLGEDIDSISISGVTLAKKESVEQLSRRIDYTGNFDCTISGSRNGYTVLVLWLAIRQQGIEGFKKLITECRQRSLHVMDILKQHGIECWQYSHAITVVLNKVPEPLSKRWCLPSNSTFTTLTALPKLTDEKLLSSR